MRTDMIIINKNLLLLDKEHTTIEKSYNKHIYRRIYAPRTHDNYVFQIKTTFLPPRAYKGMLAQGAISF